MSTSVPTKSAVPTQTPPPARAIPGSGEARQHRLVALVLDKPGVLNRVAMHTLMFMVALSRQLLPGHELTIEGVNEIEMEPTFADQRPLAMNWPESQSSNSGWLGFCPCVPNSLGVATSPRPK